MLRLPTCVAQVQRKRTNILMEVTKIIRARKYFHRKIQLTILSGRVSGKLFTAYQSSLSKVRPYPVQL
ncbi:Protein of unknown function [Pyronema omphalodes CBS 100304]|uniref:Uncharacterized protein n=1 Tax=Pyronema omphalodes (strain CBS 100304) TaxID=1076935 RepID=U4KZC2_PYROM|nr:Protein of unknown function [Pyronema omphalodes CBS 100304]